jgi:ABC-type transport system involved in multi-copper enzyme maturation permease subunit
MPAEALLFGFFGALGSVLARKQKATRTATFSFILIGVLLAGTISPFIANIIYVNVGWMGFPASQMIQNTIALAVGALWQWLMPHLWEFACSLLSRFISIKTQKKDTKND